MGMVFDPAMWILLAVSLALCCMGFYRFVWFMSVGYGLSSAGIGLTLLIMSLAWGNTGAVYLIECLLFVVYGIRLGGFLLLRELKNVSYRAKLQQVGGNTKVPVFVAVVMWLLCGVLYLLQSSGPIYRLLNGQAQNPGVMAYLGTAICAVGIWMEAMADKQKSEQKKTNPNMPAMEGLYKLCRCPNYFGEMLFWTGAFLSGADIYQGWQWLIAVLGYVEIMFVMISGAKRVEGRHIRHYGKEEAYNRYADTVPLLIPFVPLYHMTTPEKVAAEAAAKKAKTKA